jgi:DNA repair protein RadA/Sms
MKTKQLYKCKNCGASSAKWQGKCFNCEEWDTYEQITFNPQKVSGKIRNIDIQKLSSVDDELGERYLSNIEELNRVLGGGITPGSLILIGGDPGIGKSTLMLQLASNLSKYSPLYITGEESLSQIKNRAKRLIDKNLEMELVSSNSLEDIIYLLKNSENQIYIVDSIQSIHSEDISSAAGSVVQVRECTQRIMEVCKKHNKTVFLIGHITKDGAIAGPKILEHLVDTVLQFEGDSGLNYRILRTIKNRFGSTNEIGIFEMTSAGLIEVKNPSGIFLSHNTNLEPGVAITPTIEGTRPFLTEIQSLVTFTGYSMPQRIANGMDLKRLQMILSVLEKRLDIKFFKHDVFLNITGGLSINDPAADLAIAASLLSSYENQALKKSTVIIGEIGLTGEIRPISMLETRINEAAKLGFKNAIVPEQNINQLNEDIKVIQIPRLSLAISKFFS